MGLLMSIWLGLAVAALAAAGLTPAVGSPPSSAQQCPHGPPNVDYERIKTEYGEKQDTQRMWVLDWACVDQGAIILYDPLLAQRHAPEGKALPVIDVSKVEYYLRHASPLDIYTSMTRWGVDPRELLGVNATSVDGAAGSLLTSVYGSPGPYHNLVVRLPSSSELRSPRKREFSNCTVPVLIYTHWPHNLAEFFSHTLALLSVVQSQRRIWDERVTLVLATPGSLPMDSFNRRLLKAFTIHHPTTFAKLSARYDVKHPSQATGEGRHVRCFRKLIVWRNLGGHFPGVWDSARHILHYYAKDGLPPDGLWKSQEPSVMRVLIESRAADPRHTEGTKCWGRHFFGLQKLLADCNAAGQDVFSRGVGSGSRWKRVECVAHSFGKSFAADLAILNKTDVLVGFHGAGQMNSYFMPQNSSIIEIRGRNGSAKEASFMNLWQPLISTQTNFKIFWWGLFTEDPTLSTDSEFKQGEPYAIRDRCVRLHWDALRQVLEHVAAANKSAAVFSSNYFQRLAVNNVFHVPPDFATSRKIVNGPRLYETR